MRPSRSRPAPIRSRHSSGDELAGSEITQIRRRLLRWYRLNGRHDLPWRQTREPWRVLLAELMLQRTRADLVVSVYRETIRRYPTAADLADAPAAAVGRVLTPLGLHHRSRRLQKVAAAVRSGVPRTEAGLLAVPGIGRYSATATLAFAFGRRVGVIDGGVYRVLSRVFGFQSLCVRPRDDPSVWGFAGNFVAGSRARELNFALLDLAALVCRPRPNCPACPLRTLCLAAAARDVGAPIRPAQPA
jgi:A/G-specific adenine glycosylase